MHEVDAKRTTRGLSVAVVGSVALVFALAYVDSRREEARALDDFSGEQAALGRTLAATVAARAAAVERDLTAALANGGGGPELTWIDGDARIVRSHNTNDANAQKILTALFARATPGGATVVSEPQSAAGETRAPWRWFLRRGAAGGVAGGGVAALVDTDCFFDGVPPVRRIVLDDAGRWAVLGGEAPDGAWQPVQAAAEPEIAQMLTAMARGEAGTMFLPRAPADALGLGKRAAVAGYARVPIGDGTWSVAVVTSAKRVRDRARLAAWRLGAATGLTALMVGLFGVVITRQQRRAQELVEALRLAEATAALRERSEKLVESVPLGVLAVDAAARVTAVNPFLADRGARPGATLSDALPGIGADERAPLDALLAEARATRRTQARQALTLTLDGKPRDVDAFAIALARPLPDADCFLVLHDRTDAEAARAQRSCAPRSWRRSGRSSAGIAHEVGTPLGIISGRAEQLLTRVPDGEAGDAMRKGLTSILGAGRQGVDDHPPAARLRARAAGRAVEAVSPAQALGAAAALLEHRFRQAKVAAGRRRAADAAAARRRSRAARAGAREPAHERVRRLRRRRPRTARARRAADAEGGGVLLEVGRRRLRHRARAPAGRARSVLHDQEARPGHRPRPHHRRRHREEPRRQLDIDSAPGRGTTVRVVWPAAAPEAS